MVIGTRFRAVSPLSIDVAKLVIGNSQTFVMIGIANGKLKGPPGRLGSVRDLALVELCPGVQEFQFPVVAGGDGQRSRQQELERNGQHFHKTSNQAHKRKKAAAKSV